MHARAERSTSEWRASVADTRLHAEAHGVMSPVATSLARLSRGAWLHVSSLVFVVGAIHKRAMRCACL